MFWPKYNYVIKYPRSICFQRKKQNCRHTFRTDSNTVWLTQQPYRPNGISHTLDFILTFEHLSPDRDQQTDSSKETSQNFIHLRSVAEFRPRRGGNSNSSQVSPSVRRDWSRRLEPVFHRISLCCPWIPVTDYLRLCSDFEISRRSLKSLVKQREVAFLSDRGCLRALWAVSSISVFRALSLPVRMWARAAVYLNAQLCAQSERGYLPDCKREFTETIGSVSRRQTFMS